nr:MAG TPA: Large polyvalent protein associated domain 38 [Caudoviricetes sp.]
MDRKTLEHNYQKSFGASPAAELEQNYQRSGIDSLVQSVKKATQYNPSAPSTQPTQAAPAGASSRKQSDAMKEQLDTIKKQRDDAAIKAGAYMRAGNMPQQAKEQQKIANKAAIEYENAYTQWKNQRNAEAVEDYNPDENKFKAGDAALSGVQNAFQSMRQYAAAASSYLSGNPEAQAWEAKRLMESGVSGTEAVKRAGLADKREIPITDYKTQAELRHEKNVASVGAVEGGALQLVNTISNMVPSLVANAVLPGSGLPVMAASAAGNKYADAYEKYGNTDTAFVLGSAAGGASMLTEQFGGLYGSLGKSAAGQAVAKKLMAEAPGLYNLANSVGGKWLRDALSEGIEEGAEDVINYAIEKALTGDSDEMDNFGYDILLGALAGGVLGGGNAAMRSVTYSRVGKALNASPTAVAQQVQEGMEKGAGTAPAIYAAEVQKNPSSQMVGRLYEANLTYDAESGLSKIQNDITQVSINEIKAMVSKADALAQAAQKLNVEATPQAVATAITDAQRTQSIKTAEDSVGQAFAPTVDNPANAGEKAYNSALAGVAANQGVAARINNDPAARQAFSQLTGVQFSGNTAQDIAAIEVATQNIAKSGKQAISQAEYAQRVAAAGEQAAAQFDADMQAQAEQMQRESDERWLSVEQNTITDVDGKRRIKEITNTDVRGNTEIGYKRAEIPSSKKKAAVEVDNAAKYLGKTIVWYEGALQVNGQYRLSNGFRAPDGTIYVNINAQNPLMVTFGHEMFHDLVADGKYSGLIDTLVENPDYADMVKGMMNAKTELYERNGIELDPDAAAEEVAADISGDLLGSRDMLEYIGARNTEAATGIKGFLNRILKKLKGKPSAQEAYNRLSEAQRALLDGMEARSDAEEAGKISYSVMDAAVKGNNRPFAEQFADYKAGKMRPTDLFYLNNTSEYLQAAGLANEPIVMAQSVVTKAQRKAAVDTHGHELSDDVILKLPEMIEKPVLLLKSDTVPASVVVVTSVSDSSGNPVVVALHLSRNNGFDVVTRIASLYGRKNSRNFIADQLLRGNLIGYSKKEANRLLHRDGLQLPRRNPAVDFDTISVAQDTDAVNNYSMQNSAEDAGGKHSLMDIPAMDSTGRELSAEQREYFKDSKVRDEDGNLLVMYHGTTAFGYITKFKRGKKGWLGPGIYLTSKRSDAQRYADAMGEGNGRLYEMYANITKPLVVTDGNPVPGILKAAYGRDSVYKSRSEKQANDPSIVTQADINKLRAKGYDGIVWDYGGNKEVSVFSPEQVKLADNVDPTSSQDIRYSLMEDAQYMADIDKAVADAAQKANDELKAAQAEVKNIRQQLADYRQQATAEAKMNDRWRDAETKLLTEIAAAKERQKAAKARAEFMAKYDALAKQYRADLRANNLQMRDKYNEKLSEAKDEFNRRMTQDRIDRVVREDRAKSKARLRTAEQKSTTTEDVAKVLTEMPKKDKETFKAKAAKDWRTFKRQWINTKDELERFGNEVGDSRIMYAANNVGQASAAAQYSIGGAGQYDLNGKKIGDKNLMQVFEPAKKAGLTDEFYTYLLHEHNVDRMSVRENAQRQLAELRAKLNREVNGFSEMTDENIATAAGKDTTLTKAYTEAQIAAAKQYKQFQAWAEKQFDKPVFGSSVTADDSRAAAADLLDAHPEFEKWAKDVYAYLDGLMEVRKQGGLVSADMAQYMKELYPHYVPTYRDMPSTSGGYSNPNSVAVNSTIKSAKGGNQDIMPLIDSIARQTLQTFSAAKKNILGNMLYEDAMDTTRDISEYIQSVTEEGDLVDLDADSAENLKNTLRIWVDGKPVTLHMSEAMADGFRPIEQSNSFGMKALRSINSTFKKLVTQWNPVFIVRNFVRDAQSALYFTHYSNATFIKNYGKAVKEIATNGKYWQLYQAMGGKGTTYYDQKTGLSDRHHFKNGAVDKVAGGLNRVIDILSFANEAVEQYPRLAEFISTMEDTGDVQQALYNAADITTNFGRGGFAARKLNASLVPFFNPGMQGLSKNIRNVIDRRGWKEIGQLISRLLINGVAPGIIMGLLYDGLKEDDDYKELSNYIKDSNILIKIGDNKFIKVPMGREPSVITAFTNRMWRWLKGEPASSAFAGYPSFAIEQIAPNNPLTNNIFAGITAMSTNKTWYGGDIVSSYMEEKPDYLQYDESTDAFSIWLGEITRHGKNGIEGLSPKKVNYLIDQYSGFIGDWLLPALSKKADVPAVVKAFVVDSVRQNRLGSDFYDALDEAKQVKETEFATAADDATFSYLYKQSKAASEITKQLKEIYNSGEKTRKEKMSEARDLLELRNEIYRKALLTVGTYEETAKSIGSADSDVVKREANRKAFGAEYALKNYNKDVGEKAAEYVAHGVTYDQYYAAYFAARGITGDKDENGKTITNSASRKKKDAIDKAVPNATTKQKHLLYEAIGVSEKVW